MLLDGCMHPYMFAKKLEGEPRTCSATAEFSREFSQSLVNYVQVEIVEPLDPVLPFVVGQQLWVVTTSGATSLPADDYDVNVEWFEAGKEYFWHNVGSVSSDNYSCEDSMDDMYSLGFAYSIDHHSKKEAVDMIESCQDDPLYADYQPRQVHESKPGDEWRVPSTEQ
jgi:hypothetical protein